MPEPRETHAAIDARRNAQRGGGGDREALARLIAQHQRLDAPGGKCSCGHETALGDLTSRHVADAVIAAGWIPGDRPCPVHDWQEARAERDALAATVQRVRALCDGPPMHPKAPLYVRISAVRAVLDERGDIKGFGDG